MAGKTVAKGMGRGPFWNMTLSYRLCDCLLHMGLMQVIAPVFLGVGNEG